MAQKVTRGSPAPRSGPTEAAFPPWGPGVGLYAFFHLFCTLFGPTLGTWLRFAFVFSKLMLQEVRCAKVWQTHRSQRTELGCVSRSDQATHFLTLHVLT